MSVHKSNSEERKYEVFSGAKEHYSGESLTRAYLTFDDLRDSNLPAILYVDNHELCSFTPDEEEK